MTKAVMKKKTREAAKREARSQAERVIEAFGGARELSRLLLVVGSPRDPAGIYRWTYPKEKRGTGGVVPTHVWPDLFEAARKAKIEIDEDLLDPRPKAVSG